MRASRPMRSALPLLALGIVLGVGSVVAVPAPADAATGATNAAGRRVTAVHGYSGEQLTNAAVIVAVAERLGLGHQGGCSG